MADTYTKVAISMAEYKLITAVRTISKQIQDDITNNKITISHLKKIATMLKSFDALTCIAIIASIHDNATGFKKQETRFICKILRNELNI